MASMQAPASAAVVLNRAPVAQARNLSSTHAPMFGFRGCLNGGLARRHAVALKIEKPGAKGCLGGIASAGWLEDHQIQSFSREKLFKLCKKTLLFLKF